MDQLIGNSRAKQYLEKMIKTEHLGHALIFAGPRGVGKFHFALALAKQLAGPHDIHVCTPEGKGAVHTIDSLRHVGFEVALSAHAGERKIFILDVADRMHPSAASALLKTLEEPTPGALLILVTARRDRILPTLLSRAPTLYFQPLRAEEIAAYLRIDLELAEQARGSLARAKRLIERKGVPLSLATLFEKKNGDAIYASAEELAACFEEKEPYLLLEEIDDWMEEALFLFQGLCRSPKEEFQKREVQKVFQRTREAIASHSKLAHCFEFMLLKLQELALDPSYLG
ncbi:MAG: AAA family ATPase [Verrucomicrobia bacterium]|nr:AAA family ATPase [Verrucomicrobiota bacterium]